MPGTRAGSRPGPRRKETESGADLITRALFMRARLGVRAAAAWLEMRGVNEELAFFALVGSRYSFRYGVRPGLFWQRRGKPR